MNKPIDKNELHTNAEIIREKLSLLVPGSRTFRDTADEISQMFKSLKFRREDREVLWTQFDGLYKEHKTKQQTFRDEQKRNAEQIRDEIDLIQTSENFLSDGSYSDKKQWEKIREVSQMFKALKLSREERESLWSKFNTKCEALKNRPKTKKESFSEQLKKGIVEELFDARRAVSDPSDLSPGALFTTMGGLLPLDDVFRVSSSQLRDRLVWGNEVVRKCGEKLSDNKQDMLYEHKQECFLAIKETREFLDEQWTILKTNRVNEREEKQSRHNEWRDRILTNANTNREKLEKANEDLIRMENHLSDLQEKLTDVRPGNYYDRVYGWISESEEQIVSKREWIAKLEQWIEEGEEKLRGS